MSYDTKLGHFCSTTSTLLQRLSERTEFRVQTFDIVDRDGCLVAVAEYVERFGEYVFAPPADDDDVRVRSITAPPKNVSDP